MNEIPSFPCGKHEAYYIDQCAAWIEANVEIPEYYTAYNDDYEAQHNTRYIEFQHGLQAQLMGITSSQNCPLSCRCDFCDLDESQDCLEQEEEQDVLEITDCERFIDQCEREYYG